MHARTHTHTRTHTHACTHKQARACACTHTPTNIRAHTHNHAHTPRALQIEENRCSYIRTSFDLIMNLIPSRLDESQSTKSCLSDLARFLITYSYQLRKLKCVRGRAGQRTGAGAVEETGQQHNSNKSQLVGALSPVNHKELHQG